MSRLNSVLRASATFLALALASACAAPVDEAPLAADDGAGNEVKDGLTSGQRALGKIVAATTEVELSKGFGEDPVVKQILGDKSSSVLAGDALPLVIQALGLARPASFDPAKQELSRPRCPPALTVTLRNGAEVLFQQSYLCSGATLEGINYVKRSKVGVMPDAATEGLYFRGNIGALERLVKGEPLRFVDVFGGATGATSAGGVALDAGKAYAALGSKKKGENATLAIGVASRCLPAPTTIEFFAAATFAKGLLVPIARAVPCESYDEVNVQSMNGTLIGLHKSSDAAALRKLVSAAASTTAQ